MACIFCQINLSDLISYYLNTAHIMVVCTVFQRCMPKRDYVTLENLCYTKDYWLSSPYLENSYCTFLFQYFRTLNTRVSVVYIETWQGSNQAPIDKSQDISRALLNFNDYTSRKLFRVEKDTTQLLT